MKRWIARLLVVTVLGINLECALAFLWQPEKFTPAFELQGVVGAAMLRGLGVLFVMWNVPYLVAAFHPYRHRLSLWEALAMQTIGLLGESWILATVPSAHTELRAALSRFILFDGLGLAALLVAAWITRQRRS